MQTIEAMTIAIEASQGERSIDIGILIWNIDKVNAWPIAIEIPQGEGKGGKQLGLGASWRRPPEKLISDGDSLLIV